MIVGKGKGENKICMDNYFQNIFPKISGSQEDNQISIFGCPHSFLGRRGHENTRFCYPVVPHLHLKLVCHGDPKIVWIQLDIITKAGP